MQNALPPTTESHDVTIRLARLLNKGSGEPLVMDAAATATFRTWLQGFLKASNVTSTAQVIAELVYFFQEKEGCPGVAHTLLTVSDAVYGELDRRGIDTRGARSALEQAGQRFHNFAGTARALTAPRLGEAAPQGTIKAGALARPIKRG